MAAFASLSLFRSTESRRYRERRLRCSVAAISLRFFSQARRDGSRNRPDSPAKFSRKQRDRIVSSIRCGSVERRIKVESAGGSSSVFKNAFAAATLTQFAAAKEIRVPQPPAFQTPLQKLDDVLLLGKIFERHNYRSSQASAASERSAWRDSSCVRPSDFHALTLHASTL